MTTDKTGAPTTVQAGADRYTIDVDGHTVGLVEFADRDDQRVFLHTEVDDAYEGRGLATILVAEALDATRAEGKRIVPVCPLVAKYVEKHPEFADLVDQPTSEIQAWAQSR